MTILLSFWDQIQQEVCPRYERGDGGYVKNYCFAFVFPQRQIGNLFS
jgi:hypothetical protein